MLSARESPTGTAPGPAIGMPTTTACALGSGAYCSWNGWPGATPAGITTTMVWPSGVTTWSCWPLAMPAGTATVIASVGGGTAARPKRLRTDIGARALWSANRL